MKRLLMMIALLSVTLSAFSSCGKKDQPDTADTTSEPPAESVSDSGASDVLDFQPKDFGGAELVFLIRNAEAGDFETWDFVENEKNTDIINEAIRTRNHYIEETYGVLLTPRLCGGAIRSEEMYQVIYNDYFSNDVSYQVAYCGVLNAIQLAAGGIFHDLSELPYINLEHPWWDARAMSSLSISNRNFFGIGDISVQLYETLPCIAFNKAMADQYGITGLYEMVNENKWTFEAFDGIIKEVSGDIDDIDGPSVGDIFAVGGQNDNIFNFFYASGLNSVTLDSNGVPELTVYSEYNETVVSKLFDIMTNQESFFNCNDYANVPGWKNSPIEYVTDGFLSQRILFYSDGLLHLPEMKDASFQFGILPEPKYSEDQDYRHLIGVYGSTAVTVPQGLIGDQLKMTTMIIEAMGQKSQETVAKEYFERVLTLQNVRDSESADSLRIILDTKGFDMGFCFRWGELDTVLHDMLIQRRNSFYDNYQAKKNTIEVELSRTITSYINLPHYVELEE